MVIFVQDNSTQLSLSSISSSVSSSSIFALNTNLNSLSTSSILSINNLNNTSTTIFNNLNSLSTNSTLSINNLNTTSTTLLGLINGHTTQLSNINTTSTTIFNNLNNLSSQSYFLTNYTNLSNLNVSGITKLNGVTTINSTLTVSTLNINSNTINNYLFNNTGGNHATYQDFNAIDKFGYSFIQNSTNGPGTGGTQYYSWYIGLGNEYPVVSSVNGYYGMKFAVGRNETNPKLSIRRKENNVWSGWEGLTAEKAVSLTTRRVGSDLNILRENVMDGVAEGRGDGFFWWWAGMAIMSTIVSYAWDLKVEWGFLEKKAKHRYLREQLSYNRPVLYYLAIFLNIFLRYIK